MPAHPAGRTEPARTARLIVTAGIVAWLGQHDGAAGRTVRTGEA
jgi:hypothetical protein